MTKAGLALTGCVALAACGGGGGGGAPGGGGYHISSMGTGDENEAPLNPLRVGSVFGAGDQTQIIDGVVELPAGRALRLTEVYSGLVTWALQKPEGLFVVGSTIDGLEKGSVLVVPSKVRLGMKWTSSLKSGATDTFEVTARQPATPSVFGPVTQWTIERTDADGFVSERRYLEGHGNVASPPAVMLSQDPTVAPDVAPAVELEPIAVPDTFRHRVWTETVGLVRANDSVGGMFVANDALVGGELGFCGLYDGTAVTNVAPSPGKPFRRTTGPACVTTQYCAKIAGSMATFLDCSITYASGQASGVSIGADGIYTWAARSVEGGLAFADFERGGRDFKETAYRTLAAVPDDKGVGKLVYNHFAGFGDLVAEGGPELLGEAAPPTPAFLSNNLLALADLTTAIPLSDTTGGRRTMLLQTADGMLWSTTITASAVTPPVRHGRLSGELSVQASEHGNEVLRVTGDGVVQRVSVDAQGLALEPVAQLHLPTRNVAVGAFLYREPGGLRLLVASISPDGEDVDGTLTKLDLWKSKTLVTPGAPVRPARANGLRAMSAGPNFDAVVCWTGEGPPETTGWTIGGAPAVAVVPVAAGGPCVDVIRPPGMVAMPDTPFFTVEGPIPGLGRGTFLVPANPNLRVSVDALGGGESDRGAIAPLAGGGMVTGRRLYGPGGIVRGVPVDPLSSEAVRGQWVDAAGHGIWLSTMGETGGYVLRRVGETSTRVTFVDEESGSSSQPSILFASGGGGVVVRVPGGGGTSTLYHVAPDGTKTALPAPNVNRRYLGRLADGTLCGIDGGTLSMFCVPPTGPEVTSPYPADMLGGPSEHLLPTNEGYFALPPILDLPGVTGYSALDAKTAALVKGKDSSLERRSFCPAADGSMWGVVNDQGVSGGALVPVRFRKDGVERLVIPDGLVPKNDLVARVVPDQDVLLLILQQSGSYVLMARPK